MMRKTKDTIAHLRYEEPADGDDHNFSTWNPVTGCTKVSNGCANCYAERTAERFQAMGQYNYRHGFKVTLQPHMLELPLDWCKQRRVFVNSMSDLFHEDVPFEFIDQVFAVMNVTRAHVPLPPRKPTDWHTYQVLTKRPRRAAEYLDKRSKAYGLGEHPVMVAGRELMRGRGLDLMNAAACLCWPLTNVWLGTSCENQETAEERIPHLLRCPAAVRFLSLEPLLGPIQITPPKGIDWVIVGGEYGPRARRMELDWVRDIILQCKGSGTACFVKQLGGARDKRGDPGEWPEDLRVREYPK